MKLYRFVHKDELGFMKNGDVEKLGKEFDNDVLANSHTYKKGKRYLHFFYNKKACQHIIDDIMFKELEITKTGIVKNYYICTFSIPAKVLFFRTGFGNYKSLTIEDRGYCQTTKLRFEAAIESDLFDKSWLKKVELAVFTKGTHKKEIFCEEIRSR